MQSLWMIVASLLFAFMGVFVKLASDTFSAIEIVFYRSAISCIFMTVIVYMRGITLRTPHWRIQLTRSVFGFFGLLLFFYAVSLLPLATAVTLNYTSPLFLALFLCGMGRMPFRLSLLGALALGFVGVVLLLRPTFQSDQLLGGVIGLVSGVVSGLAYFNVRELGELGETEERTVFYFTLFSSVVSGAWMLMGSLHTVDGRGLMLLLSVGVLATAAQLAMTRAYKRGKTLVSASLAYTTVAFSSVLGMFVWSEMLSPAAWGAIALIVASGLATTWFSRANPADQD